jgi:RNA-directed DNA polymerase
MQKKQYKQPKKEGWYLSKKYPHLDLPLSFENTKKYVTDASKIAKHNFYPFMSYEKKERRYRGKFKKASNKIRPIKYASHLDGNIYSYYALMLKGYYEQRISLLGLNEVAIGYRSGKGSNIHLAEQVFCEIKSRKNCVAIAVDINNFYGHIDHLNLKREWCLVLGVDKLPADHFVIFKSLTKSTSVDRTKLSIRLNHSLKKLPLRLVKNAKEFRMIRDEDKRKPTDERIFEKNINSYGIPQGSPLSSLLSNIYMIPFDKKMNELAKEIGGFYRRYSDDILFICDENLKVSILEKIDAELRERGNALIRNQSKDHISTFNIDKNTSKQICDKEFQYLGFSFNGKATRIRSQTLSKYFRRLKLSVRKAKKSAGIAEKKYGNKTVFRKGLNKRFTHLGTQGFIPDYVRNVKKTMGKKHINKQIKDPLKRLTEELT